MWLLNELKKYSQLENTAMIYKENKITYKDLWDKSEKLACFIEERCKTRSPIVIYGNKDIDITAAMIAVIKTGRTYVPVDITFPKERLMQIISMVKCEFAFNFTDIKLDGDFSIVDRAKIESLYTEYQNGTISEEKWLKPDDTCYILFTSGSTGLPKGVQITRKNIENFVSWFNSYCDPDIENQVVLNQVSYSFDVSVIALYIYLAQGKTLFNIDKDMLEHINILFEYLKESGISVWISTPTLLEICSFDSSFNSELLPKLKKFILAGEVLTKKLVTSLWDKFDGSTVINGYGPTEGTVLLSACKVTGDMISDKKAIPIGRILPDSIHYILGQEGEPVKEGESGELVVISDSISKGYYNNPLQTGKVFFKTADGKMGYKTGDLVFQENNLLYYIARKDFQVKLNGFRIELDDITNNLNKIEFINNSIVLPAYKNQRISYLAAFVTLSRRLDIPSINISIQIKNELKKLIPSYMIPRKIIVLDRFPLNTNGKIDRTKLMEAI